jgi:hypothetical protein
MSICKNRDDPAPDLEAYVIRVAFSSNIPAHKHTVHSSVTQLPEHIQLFGAEICYKENHLILCI